jgi:hypothetical protein
MIANTPGNFPTERVDRRTVLPAKVATFTERKKTRDMLGGWVGDKASVAVEPSKNNNARRSIIEAL